MKRILKIMVMLSVGVYLNFYIVDKADHDSIFDGIINLALGAVLIGLFAWVLLTYNKEYRLLPAARLL